MTIHDQDRYVLVLSDIMKRNEKHNDIMLFLPKDFISTEYSIIVAILFAYTEQMFVLVTNHIKPFVACQRQTVQYLQQRKARFEWGWDCDFSGNTLSRFVDRSASSL